MTSQRGIAALLVTGAGALLAFWGDPFSLQLVAYIPILIFGWLFKPEESPGLGQILSEWMLWRSLLVLVAAAVLLMLARRIWSARPLLVDLDRTALRRVLTISVTVAVACPVLYAVTRLAWFMGIPLGLDPEFFDSVQPILANGLVLGVLALGGAVLTIGLTRPWGEMFWRWLPFVGGKPVPMAFVRRFAYSVALLVTSGGAFFIRAKLAGKDLGIAPEGAENQWGAWLPEMVWPLWGLALAMATVAYCERRRRTDSALENLQPMPVAG